MARIKLEYIWLDGYTPVASLRSKTKIVDGDVAAFTLADAPGWGFDGSSTQQAEGKKLDCLLKPVAFFPIVREGQLPRHERGDAAEWRSPPHQHPRHDPRRFGRLVRF